MELLSRLEGFRFHTIHVYFYPDESIELPYWIGAVIRNRFLYAAQQVDTGQGKTLYDLFNTFPLPEGHPYYKQLKKGFPKGFVIDCGYLSQNLRSDVLYEGKQYIFSLSLIGKCASYVNWVIEALRLMADEGFGYPMVPLTLLKIEEGEDNTIYDGMTEEVNPLRVPLGWRYMETSSYPATVSLYLCTPVSLVSRNHKPKTGDGYQDKLNNFPSFYQFVRSAVYRLFTLNMLYVNPEACFTSEEVDEFVKDAARAELIETRLWVKKCHSTPREGKKNVYTMSGFMGEMAFKKVDRRYLSFLDVCEFLGVGNDINFGLGQFRVKY